MSSNLHIIKKPPPPTCACIRTYLGACTCECVCVCVCVCVHNMQLYFYFHFLGLQYTYLYYMCAQISLVMYVFILYLLKLLYVNHCAICWLYHQKPFVCCMYLYTCLHLCMTLSALGIRHHRMSTIIIKHTYCTQSTHTLYLIWFISAKINLFFLQNHKRHNTYRKNNISISSFSTYTPADQATNTKPTQN